MENSIGLKRVKSECDSSLNYGWPYKVSCLISRRKKKHSMKLVTMILVDVENSWPRSKRW